MEGGAWEAALGDPRGGVKVQVLSPAQLSGPFTLMQVASGLTRKGQRFREGSPEGLKFKSGWWE